jgi:hypothetical protein
MVLFYAIIIHEHSMSVVVRDLIRERMALPGAQRHDKRKSPTVQRNPLKRLEHQPKLKLFPRPLAAYRR